MFAYRPNEIGMQGLLGIQNQALARRDGYDNMQLQRDMQSNELGMRRAQLMENREQFAVDQRNRSMIDWARLRQAELAMLQQDKQFYRSDDTQRSLAELSAEVTRRGQDVTERGSIRGYNLGVDQLRFARDQFNDNVAWRDMFVRPFQEDNLNLLRQEQGRRGTEQDFRQYMFDADQLQPVPNYSLLEGIFSNPTNPLGALNIGLGSMFGNGPLVGSATNSARSKAQRHNRGVADKEIDKLGDIAQAYIGYGGNPTQIPGYMNRIQEGKSGTGSTGMYAQPSPYNPYSWLQNRVTGGMGWNGAVNMLQIAGWPKLYDSANGQVSPTNMPYNHQYGNPYSNTIMQMYPRYTGNATGQ